MNTKEIKSELSQKLRECASKVGGGNELARKTGIPRRTLENYLQGNTEPAPSRLMAIAEAARADLFWLMAGTGPFKPAGESRGSDPSGHGDRLEKMRLISATLRQAIEQQQHGFVDRQLWTDLQGLAYIHNLSHEAIPPIVQLLVRAYELGRHGSEASRAPSFDTEAGEGS